MDTSDASIRRQWCQLLALTLTHAVADTYVGIIAPVIAPLRDHYAVSIATLIFVSSLLGVSANVLQIPIGHLRANRTSPRLIILGVLLAGLSVFMVALPADGSSVVWMSVLAVIAGLGVATVHPEGLRAIHGLDQIPASLSTAVFMVAGFAGFAGGALISSTLTDHFGLGSLVWLYAAAPLSAIPLALSGIRLPTEKEKPATAPASQEEAPCLSFPLLFIMASILATSSQIQATLLPTYLHEEAGYSLSFSGLSFTLFGLGGMVGAVLWGALAPRLGPVRILLAACVLGAPLTLLYLIWAPKTEWAAALLTFTGFVVYTGFPLCIALARHARSQLRLGQRMGLISGGSWGIAAAVLWVLGPLSERAGMGPFLHLIWAGYLLTAALVCIRVPRALLMSPRNSSEKARSF